jgi:hypothetical protein
MLQANQEQAIPKIEVQSWRTGFEDSHFRLRHEAFFCGRLPMLRPHGFVRSFQCDLEGLLPCVCAIANTVCGS